MQARQVLSLASRRAPAVRVAGRRFATAAPEATKADSSHLLAGLGGGALVLGGIYGYYHYSGTAKVVNSARSFTESAAQAKNTLTANAPSPKQAVDLLRSATKSYVAMFPGAAGIVDHTFDSLEAFAEEHGEQAQKIMSETYADIEKALKEGKGSSDQLIKAIQKAGERIQEVVGDKGQQALDKLYEKSPELKKVVGSGSDELQKLADKHGPEAKKILDDTYKKASDIVSKGGLNAKTYEAVKSLYEEKKKQITSLAKKSGSDAWDGAAKAAGPALEKMPDIQKLVSEKLQGLEGLAGEDNIKVVKDLYAELEKIGKSGKSSEDMAKDAKKLIESKSGSFSDLQKAAKQGLDSAKDAASSKGGDLASYASSIPGLAGLAKVLDVDSLKQLKDLSEKHGHDAEKLLESTYDEIKKVLEKKISEGKSIAEDAANDAKKEAKK